MIVIVLCKCIEIRGGTEVCGCYASVCACVCVRQRQQQEGKQFPGSPLFPPHNTTHTYTHTHPNKAVWFAPTAPEQTH